MEDKNKIKIMIVDDHEFFRKGVMITLKHLKYAEIIGEAGDGLEFLKFIEIKKPDIVLLDIKMPIMNGIEAAKIALERYPDLKIIALTMHEEREYIEKMIKIGVKGFMLKTVTKNELDRALRLVNEGKTYYSQELLTFFTASADRKQSLKENKGILTKREIEILEYLAKGMTNKEIGLKLFISVRTVANHRANMIDKTGTKNTAELLSYAMNNGII
ncbi:MAG: response regulator transcription factor [Bacteroidota bacterium]|nr:response regulator transcription factor [Bacteroidota bacterium]